VNTAARAAPTGAPECLRSGDWRPRYLLFDLDGTIVDSAPDLTRAVNATLRELHLPTRSEEEVRAWVGNGARSLVRRVLVGGMEGWPDRSLHQRAYERFLGHYQDTLCDRTRPYPGVAEALARLQQRGYALACVTNKPSRFTLPLLAALGLDVRFGVVVSGDTVATKKPDPLPLYHAVTGLGAPDPRRACREQSLMIGDSVTDIDAARAAGSIVICVRYGYNHGRDIAEARPDGVIDSMQQLCELLERAV